MITPGSTADFVLYRGDIARAEFSAAGVVAVAKSGVLAR
jgi:hypothetical protein